MRRLEMHLNVPDCHPLLASYAGVYGIYSRFVQFASSHMLVQHPTNDNSVKTTPGFTDYVLAESAVRYVLLKSGTFLRGCASVLSTYSSSDRTSFGPNNRY